MQHSAPPSQCFGSSHPALFEGRWVSPFMGPGGAAFGPFGGGRSLGLEKALGRGALCRERRVSERSSVFLRITSTFSSIGFVHPASGVGG